MPEQDLGMSEQAILNASFNAEKNGFNMTSADKDAANTARTTATNVVPVQHVDEEGVVGGVKVMPTTTFDHGRNSDVDATAEQLTATSVVAKRGVLVKAANANTGIIYVGNSDVTANSADATDGFELGAGESVLIEIDNVNKLYVIASAANQAVYWMSV